MAGGMGNRLKPFTNILPKPLIPVKGKTIIERIISNFYKFGFKDYKFIVNYKSLILKAYLKELKTSINTTHKQQHHICLHFIYKTQYPKVFNLIAIHLVITVLILLQLHLILMH